MDTINLLVKTGKKNLEKIGFLGNQKPELKFSGTQIQIPEKFRFRYGLPFYQPKISGTQTETSFGLSTRTIKTPTMDV